MTNLALQGPKSSWARSVESFPLSRVLPLYHCSLACKSVGTIVYDRGGFGGHILSGRYQSFIPACNSTTVRGEMARLGRTEVRFPEKLKCQTMNGKQNCADIMSTNYHHLCCKPFRSTIIVYYQTIFRDHFFAAESNMYQVEKLPIKIGGPTISYKSKYHYF